MAADKRDKGGPHLPPPHSNPRRRPNMDGFSYFFIFFCLVQYSGAADYKLCTTADHETLCKILESSRSEITCVQVSDSVDCLLKMQDKEADFGTFSPEEAFLAARFLGNEGAVLAEVRHPDREDRPFYFETVAVVRKTLFGGLSALKGMSYCHPGFSKAQYWSDRVLKDFERRVLEHFKDDLKCNSAMRSAYEDDLYRLSMIFSKACRPGTWAVSDWWDKKLKRDYHTLCDQCERPGTCSYEVRNRGRHSDALRCLTRHGGNVTYTALEYVKQYFDLDSEDESGLVPEYKEPSRFSFLCPDGATVPLTTKEPCSWIKQPWTSVIALNKGSDEMRKNLQNWLQDDSNVWSRNLRSILAKGDGVLKFRDRPINVSDYIKEGRSIPLEDEGSCRSRVRWCTINKEERRKCEFISSAALTHGLPTRVGCVEATSKFDCLKKVSNGEADIVYVDSELGHISRKIYKLTAAAFVETQRTGNYHGVVVVKGNSIKRLKDLQGKRACFPQYNGLGWLTYIEVLKSLSVVPGRSCSGGKKAWNYFSKVCAPGAKDPNVNVFWQKVPDRLCSGCAPRGTCAAEEKNPFYGETGAFECLQHGGEVGFLDFNAIRKYLASMEHNSPELLQELDDYKILCKDGSLENLNLTNPDKCSFTQLNGGEVLRRRDLDQVRETDITHTLLELDDLFGFTSRAYNPALKMFEPFGGKRNLLFKESAVSLVSVYQTQNRFVNNYMKLLDNLENCYEDNGSSVLVPSVFAVFFSILFILYP